jgi:hypothetical protein
MFPLQLKFPLVPSSVHPVSADPPERTICPLAPVGPTLSVVVAPPAKLIVVATLLRRSNDVLPVVIDVAMAGDVMLGVLLNTTTPVPVSSESEEERSLDTPDVERLLLELTNSALDAVRLGTLITESLSTVFPVPPASSVRSSLPDVVISLATPEKVSVPCAVTLSLSIVVPVPLALSVRSPLAPVAMVSAPLIRLLHYLFLLPS